MQSTDGWRPQLVYLYKNKGVKILQKFDMYDLGAKDSLSDIEWAELLPAVDFAKLTSEGMPIYEEPGTRKNAVNHPGATSEFPAWSAARYMVVSTSESWPTNVWGQLVEGKAKSITKLEKDLAKANQTARYRKNVMVIVDRKKIEAIQKRINDTNNASTKKLACHHIATRKISYEGSIDDNDDDEPATTTKQRNVLDEVRRPAAGFIVWDELHDKANLDTNTYQQVLGVLKTSRPQHTLPACIGMSGTPLEGGVKLALNFVTAAMKRDTWASTTTDETAFLRTLSQFDAKKLGSTWDKLISNATKSSKVADIATSLAADNGFKSLMQIMDDIISNCIIQRDFKSTSPGGFPLVIIDCSMDFKYKMVEYGDEEKSLVAEVENGLKARVEEAIKEWKADGAIGEPPKATSKSTRGYHETKIMCTLPHIYNAIWAWQSRNPNKLKVICDKGDDEDSVEVKPKWGRSLGDENEVLKTELSELNSTLIAGIAKDAVKGAVKYDMCLAKTRERAAVFRTVRDPANPQRNGKKWREKTVIMVPSRLVRAIFAYVSYPS
jgi:hypothetical protein